MGGENGVQKVEDGSDEGSSPRGRGKPVEAELRVADRGLIPAWAGKTLQHAPPRAGAAAHPRVGGENASARSRCDSTSGSSPRGRGKLVVARAALEGARLIPAWAGKTKAAQHGICQGRAHPRVGGENDDDHTHIPSVAGSSPRGRGKRVSVARPGHL